MLADLPGWLATRLLPGSADSGAYTGQVDEVCFPGDVMQRGVNSQKVGRDGGIKLGCHDSDKQM